MFSTKLRDEHRSEKNNFCVLDKGQGQGQGHSQGQTQ